MNLHPGDLDEKLDSSSLKKYLDLLWAQGSNLLADSTQLLTSLKYLEKQQKKGLEMLVIVVQSAHMSARY